MNRMSFVLALSVAVLAVPVSAANLPTALELRLQTIESRLPEPGRLEALTSKVQRLAQKKGGAVSGTTGAAAAAAGGDVLFNLYQQVQTLTHDVRSLRGDIQEIKHGVEQRKQRQRDLYMDLSKRLKVLEQKLGIGESVGAADAGATLGDAIVTAAGNGDLGVGAGKRDAQQAYEAAFAQLSSGNIDQAGTSFAAFVRTYPYSEYTDNAWYWLGSTRYINREYKAALTALRHVLDDFPNSTKVPDAIYKMGVILDEQGKYDQARATLQRAINQYPDSNAAKLAHKRLDAMTDG